MNEIKPVEGMVIVFDPAVHVDAASRASVPVDGLSGVDNLQLLAVLDDADARTRHDSYHGEGGPLGLPAARAAADVIMGALARDFHLDLIARTFADQRSAGKVRGCRLQTLIDEGWIEIASAMVLLPCAGIPPRRRPSIVSLSKGEVQLCFARRKSLNERTFVTTSKDGARRQDRQRSRLLS